MKNRLGFTLVELAIVITIIGLLIGGVLKGQELLENARMTSTAAQLKSFATAGLTFRDIYKAYPGDIISPGNFLEGCTTSPCNVSGDGNGEIGPVYTGSLPYYNNENNNFWLHLAKAKLLGGIDPNSTWSGSAYYLASLPDNKMGGKITLVSYNHNIAPYTQGVRGRYAYMFQPSADGQTSLPTFPVNNFAKFDLKVDDGKPWTGDALLDSAGCGVSASAVVYDPNVKTLCTFDVKMDF